MVSPFQKASGNIYLMQSIHTLWPGSLMLMNLPYIDPFTQLYKNMYEGVHCSTDSNREKQHRLKNQDSCIMYLIKEWGKPLCILNGHMSPMSTVYS